MSNIHPEVQDFKTGKMECWREKDDTRTLDLELELLDGS